MFSKKRSVGIFVTVVILMLAVVAAGCSSTAKGQDKGVNVDMTNFAFNLDKSEVPAGKITFHVKNAKDAVEHEMVVIKTDLDAAQLPTNADQTVDESKLDSKGEVEVEAGETKDLTVDLTPGHYVLLCNVPGHYAQGMVANFTVR